jgi:DNA-binding response OmpR family regulator
VSARILVVDDDPIQRALMAEYLGLAGFEVWEEENGARALARSMQDRPDLILLDVHMPEMSGLEVIRHIRSSAPLQDLPVLFVSSIATEQAKVRGLEQGADDYIVKPCAQAELLARVRAALRRSDRSPKSQG